MMVGFFRIVKFAFQDIARNLSLSFMTVLILILMLLSINTLLVIRVLTDQAVASVKDKIDLSIFFKNDAKEKQIEEIKSHINSFPEVVKLTFITREQALESFKKEHSGNTEILSSLDELAQNPLGPSLVVKTRDPNDYKKITASLDVPEYAAIIEAKTFTDTEKTIDRIRAITKQVEQFSFGLSALFAFIAFLIIFNTIRVAVYTQRIEISIKRLVGATSWFIRGPYVVEALVFSLIATGMSYGFAILSTRFLDPYISVVFESRAFLTDYFSSNMVTIISLEFFAVLALTIFTSLLAMRKYLRV